MLEGALIFLGGLLAGVVVRSLPPRRKPVAALPPVCHCRHARSFHEEGTGRCHGVDRLKRYSAAGATTGFDAVECTCLRYDGPEPIPTLYAPPLQLPPQ